MAPKKAKGQKMALTDFLLNDEFGSSSGNWADDVEQEINITSDSQMRTFQNQKSHPNDNIFGRPGFSDRGDYGRGDRPFFAREPRPMPDAPPYKAHVSGLPYDIPEEELAAAVEQAFSNYTIQDMSPVTTKGESQSRFMFITFATRDDLVAVAGDNPEPIFVGEKKVFVSVADRRDANRRPQQDGRDLDWSRKGPLPPDPTKGQYNERRPSGFERRGPSDFGGDRGDRGDRQANYGERRTPREDAPPSRVIDWSFRSGPLSPRADDRPDSRSGSRPRASGGYAMDSRSGSYRGDRRASPAQWPEGREPREGGSRPPRREFSERPERTPSAAELDSSWRSHMRPNPPRSGTQSRDGSEAPPSPSGPAPAVTIRPGGRPVLNLAKRTVSDTPDVTSPAPLSASSKSNPFGAARPIDTTAREREIVEKREAAAKAKREAEQKAKEERLAKEKEAREKEVQEKEAREAAEAALAAEAAKAAEAKTDEKAEETKDVHEEGAKEAATTATRDKPNSASGQSERRPPRSRGEFREREPSQPKSRAAESINWRSASGEQRAPRGAPSGPRGRGSRGGGRYNSEYPPRSNGAAPVVEQSQPPSRAAQTSAPPTPTPEDDGWTTVKQTRRGPRPGV